MRRKEGRLACALRFSRVPAFSGFVWIDFPNLSQEDPSFGKLGHRLTKVNYPVYPLSRLLVTLIYCRALILLWTRLRYSSLRYKRSYKIHFLFHGCNLPHHFLPRDHCSHIIHITCDSKNLIYMNSVTAEIVAYFDSSLFTILFVWILMCRDFVLVNCPLPSQLWRVTRTFGTIATMYTSSLRDTSLHKNLRDG